MQFAQSRVLNDSVARREYQPSKDASLHSVVAKSLHYGQRKLLLSEIELLTALLTARKENKTAFGGPKPLLVVYAGAANGQHLPVLFELFKEVRYVLIDPAPFCSEVQAIAANTDGPIVEIVSDYCTDEVCLRLSRCYGEDYAIVLVSDIRSGVPKKMTGNSEHTELIMRDNAWQRGFCVSLKAECAMLKFHPPYPPVTDTAAPNYDPKDTTPESIGYFAGTQLFGVWAPKSSSEVRLVVPGPFDGTTLTTTYSCRGHEEQCYHYNTTDRYLRDCAAERTILQQYIDFFPGVYADVAAFSAHLSEKLRHPLFTPLASGFTEDHARWLHLLLSVRGQDAVQYYEPLKDAMTVTKVKELVETYKDAEAIPTEVEVGGVTLSNAFWNFFMRGDFVEAYCFPRLRWAALMGSKPDGATQHRKWPNRNSNADNRHKQRKPHNRMRPHDDEQAGEQGSTTKRRRE